MIMKRGKLELIDSYFDKLGGLLAKLDRHDLTEALEIIEKKYKNKKKIFLAGNGGSAASASHAVVDLNKTILGHGQNNRHLRLKAISLSDNIPTITAVGNDISYDEIFAEPLKNLADPGDLLVVLTGSGNSPNIISVLKAAKKLQVETIGLLGFDGGKAIRLVDHKILVPSESYGHIEDIHMIFIHLLTEHLKKNLIIHG